MTLTHRPPCPARLRDRRGRHFVVVGGGKTGAAAARLLLREGARVTIVDDGAVDKVRADLQRHGLAADASVAIVAGGLDAGVIADADVIVLSPGVPRAHTALAGTLATKPIINELELGLAVLTRDGADLDGVDVWAITGTNGKSTTTTMAGAIAKRIDAHAFVGGNLGLPLCAAVVDGLQCGEPGAPRRLVVELSSYQLETLSWFPVTGAAFTNLTPDHLDRYPSVDAYYDAKARLIPLAHGVALNAADPESQRRLAPAISGVRATCHFDVLHQNAGVEIVDVSARALHLVVRRDGAERSIAVDNAHIVGHHNRQNAAAAAALAVLAGVSDDAIAGGLTDYAGIAHRLERVGAHLGVTWWNDSKATNVDAAVIAVRSFAGGVHLIAGGLGKGSPYTPLVEAARGRVLAVYTIGKDAPALADALRGSGIDVVDADRLEAACALAAARAQPGEHIVLSPACASFDQFKDYNHRGEVFRACFAVTSAQVRP